MQLIGFQVAHQTGFGRKAHDIRNVNGFLPGKLVGAAAPVACLQRVKAEVLNRLVLLVVELVGCHIHNDIRPAAAVGGDGELDHVVVRRDAGALRHVQLHTRNDGMVVVLDQQPATDLGGRAADVVQVGVARLTGGKGHISEIIFGYGYRIERTALRQRTGGQCPAGCEFHFLVIGNRILGSRDRDVGELQDIHLHAFLIRAAGNDLGIGALRQGNEDGGTVGAGVVVCLNPGGMLRAVHDQRVLSDRRFGRCRNLDQIGAGSGHDRVGRGGASCKHNRGIGCRVVFRGEACLLCHDDRVSSVCRYRKGKYANRRQQHGDRNEDS